MRPRAADEVHQHGLRVVGGGVGRRDAGVPVSGQLAEKRVPHAPAAVLGAKTLPPRQGGDVGPPDEKRDAPLRAEAPRRLLIPVRGLPQTVIDVRRGDTDAVFLPVRKKEMGKRRGIRSSRKAGHDGAAGREHRIPGDYPFDFLFNFFGGACLRVTGHDAQPPPR